MRALFYLLPFIVLFSFGCKKIKFKRYVGHYNVKHYTKTWEAEKPTEYIIEEKTINIFRKSDYLDVVGRLVHIDSLKKKEAYYLGTPDNHFKLKFINDSIYYYTINTTETGGKENRYEGLRE